MAKRKQYIGNSQSTKKDEIERLKEQAIKAKEKSSVDREQKLIDKMGEEEAKLFMSQEEILLREVANEKREKELKQQEDELSKKLEDLEGRKKAVAEQEASITVGYKEMRSIEREIGNKKNSLEKKERELLDMERSLIERENNAENEFALQNQKALEVLRKRQAELQKSIAIIESQRIESEAMMSEEVQKLRQQKLDVLNKDLKALYDVRKKELDSKLAQIEKVGQEHVEYESKLIQEEKTVVEKAQKELIKAQIELEEKKRSLEAKEENIRFEQRMFEEEKKINEKKIEQQVEQQVEDIKFELDRAQDEVKHYKKRLEACEKRIFEYEQQEREADGHTFEDLLKMNEILKGTVEKLRRERAELPDEDLFIEYKAKADAFDENQLRLNETKAELATIQQEKMTWEKTTNALQIEREKCVWLEKRREVLEATIQKYGEEVNRFRSLYEQPRELSGRLDAILKYKLPVERFRESDIVSEVEWLDLIYDKCVESGVEFNKRLLKSFHTSLKTAGWSPLTVLAGVSGTGKSLLPEYYCRYGGMYFMSMAVQPDWDSPQSLFGYFNSVDNRFNATTLLRAMTQFSDYDKLEETIQKMLKTENADEYLKKLKVDEYNLNEAMFLVLLDEMNLAHVELYFSDMLSKLERRRNSNENVAVEIDLGAGMDKFPLELTDNILWVGTMNEDETTKSLSDKVLDRGNLISFPRPKQFISRSKTESMDAAPMLRRSTWESWVSESVIDDENFKKMITKYKTGLEAVNEAMEFAGRALGHRVWQSIENYMANHPDVIAAFKEESIDITKCDMCLSAAFEEGVVHKVMPKLRGIETDGNTRVKCIDRIKDTLFTDALAPGLEPDFENAINTAYETFLWSSAKYLEIEE